MLRETRKYIFVVLLKILKLFTHGFAWRNERQ